MVKKAQSKPKKSSVASKSSPQVSKEEAKINAKEAASKLPPIPSSFKLLKEVYQILKDNWKVLGGIVLVYSILNLVLASGVLSNLSTVVNNVQHPNSLSGAFNGFGSLIGGSSGGAQGSSVAQSVLFILESLVIIWALRHLLAGQKIGVKQAFYQSMGPLVPFVLVILMIVINLLPITVGSGVLGLVLSSAVGSSAGVTVIFGFFFVLLAAWSIYLVSASIFSLYIVTLPDMQPRQALRSAKDLVRFRRWPLLRRLFFLPLFVLLVMGLVIVPLILIAPSLAAPVYFALLMLTILFAHAYLYSLYKGLMA